MVYPLITTENCCHRDLNPGLPESLASASSRAASVGTLPPSWGRVRGGEGGQTSHLYGLPSANPFGSDLPSSVTLSVTTCEAGDHRAWPLPRPRGACTGTWRTVPQSL